MNKPNIFIVSGPHLDVERNLWLGGLDKYTDTLATKLVENGYNVFFHEISVSGDFEICRNGFVEKGHDLPRSIKKSIPKILNFIKKLDYYSTKDIIIYSTDYLASFNNLPNSIAIQHGIAWDIPFYKKTIKNKLKPHFLLESKIKALERIDKLVCVDYNYPNWIRATFPFSKLLNKIKVITNFTEIGQFSRCQKNDSDVLKICFARRFEDYRGVLIFANAIRLLEKEKFFNKLMFVFAGKGKKEKEIKKIFENYSNVHFDKYNSTDGVKFHQMFDIAVVPTIGSEGTSLSALEAMSAGCGLICTSVGGLSNIVISNYNGIIVEPTAESIADAIKTLVLNRDLLFNLQKRGYEVVRSSFNIDNWFNKWIEVIECLQK